MRREIWQRDSSDVPLGIDNFVYTAILPGVQSWNSIDRRVS